METVVFIVNKIRGGHNALTHRRFKLFLDELNANYKDLKMFTAVRWLSKGQCLERFFDIRKEVLLFLKSIKFNEATINEVESSDFQLNLAFLTDITEHLNILNLKLQGENKHIFNLISNIEGFKNCLKVLLSSLRKNDIQHFKRTSETIKEFSNMDLTEYINYMENLIEQFNNRFSDFECIKMYFDMYLNPMTCTIDKQPTEYQIELCLLQSDIDLLPFTNPLEFWKKCTFNYISKNKK